MKNINIEPAKPEDGDKILEEKAETASVKPEEGVSAGFNERLVAYVIDALPFVVLCYWSLSLFSQMGLITHNPENELQWKFLWILLYLLYETVLSSGPRATVGKYLMGIRVRAADGSYLSVGRAFLRSAGYFASSTILNVGFLMVLWTKNKRGLHDFIGSSRVVKIRRGSAAAEFWTTVLAWAMLAFFIGSWVNQNIIQLSPREKQQVILAKRSLLEISKLEERHKQIYGGYTNDIKRLVVLSSSPGVIKRNLLKYTRPDTIEISSNGRDFIISAEAKNWRKTRVEVSSISR